MLKRCKYFAFQSWASFLEAFAPLPCRQRKIREIRKAAPSSALMLAAIATWFSDDDDDDIGEDEVVTGTVVVLVAMIVVVTVSVMLGDVEPDVRLYITNPASTENGSALPLVGI